jgi:uncharacterized protein
VSVTITDYNLENIPNLTKYLLKKNIPFAFNFYRENFYTKNSLNKHNNKKLITYLKIAYKIIQENPPEYKIINGLLDRVNFKYPHTHTCGMGKNYIVIRHDGSIVSCQMTLDKPIGSIDNLDLINLIRTNTIAKNPKDLHVNNKSICKDCFWKYICCGGCPLLSLETTGSCNTKSPYCEVYKALIPEVLKIEAQRILKYGETKNTQN